MNPERQPRGLDSCVLRGVREMGSKPSRRRYRQRYTEHLMERHADAVAHVRALADEDLADDDLCRDLALWVRRYRHTHNNEGPYWSLIARRVRPDLLSLDTHAPKCFLTKVYVERLVPGLKARRWLNYDRGRQGSTRQGPRVYEDGTLSAKDRRVARVERPQRSEDVRPGRAARQRQPLRTH